MQSRPKQIVKASGLNFCILCYPVLISEEDWDKDHTMGCREWECHGRQRTKVPAWLERAAQQGVGPVSGSRGTSHPGITAPSEPWHLCLLQCLFQFQFQDTSSCPVELLDTCASLLFSLILEANCGWETEVIVMFSGKRGSEVGSGTVLVCFEKMGLVWDECFPFLI